MHKTYIQKCTVLCIHFDCQLGKLKIIGSKHSHLVWQDELLQSVELHHAKAQCIGLPEKRCINL